MSKNNGLENLAIPTIDLAKTTAAEGTVAWLKATVAEHGDTDAQKLEIRRARISAYATISERGIKRVQAEKKAVAAKYAEAIEAIKKEMRGAKVEFEKRLISATLAEEIEPIKKEMGETLAVLTKKLDSAKNEAGIVAAQFDAAIEDKAEGMAMVEGICLIVDSLTLREEAEHIQTGKKGLVRTSSAALIDELLTVQNMCYRRLKKLYDLTASINPLLVPLASEDDEDPEAPNCDENEIVTEAQRRAAKEEVES